MILGFYTSRVLLSSLGIDNFGIYNVVGGFVGLFTILTATMTATTQRYITFELGKPDGNPKRIFGAVMGIHLVLAVVMFIALESIGLWFLNYELNIPSGRLYAANWVFQFSVLCSLLGLFSTPYIGVIVAQERMKAFAYISMQDAILKLLICYLLYIIPFDRLIVYSGLFSVVLIIDQFIYIFYCHKNFPEARIQIPRDKTLYKSMFGFAGMNFIGSFTYILNTQGVNIILNLFFGVVVNAARGIATQVQGAVTRFVNDFMMALNPQITKEYASGNRIESMKLSFRGARFSYYLLLAFSLPIMVRANEILHVWLNEYPEYSVIFLQYTLITALVGAIASPMVTVLLATGNLKANTWWIGGTRLLAIPIIYLAFKMGGDAVYAYIIILLIDIILIFVRADILEKITKCPFRSGLVKTVIPKIIMTTAFATITLIGLNLIINHSLWGLILYCILAVFLTGGICFVIGLSKHEKDLVISYVKAKLHSHKN